MKRGLVLAGFVVLGFGLVPPGASPALAAARDAYVRQATHRVASEAYVRQVAPVRVAASFPSIFSQLRARERMRPPLPIPSYAAPGLSGDEALGFFSNANRSFVRDRARIFLEIMR